AAPTALAVLNDATPTLSGSAASASGDSATVTVKIWAGVDTSGTLLQTLNATRTGASWTMGASALAEGTYTARAEQTNFAVTLLTSGTVTFRIDTTAPAVTVTSL